MKAIVTLIVVLFFSFTSIAQNDKEVKVETTQVSIVLKSAKAKTGKLKKKVARIYMFKNSRVKKELSFTTKRNRSKLA